MMHSEPFLLAASIHASLQIGSEEEQRSSGFGTVNPTATAGNTGLPDVSSTVTVEPTQSQVLQTFAPSSAVKNPEPENLALMQEPYVAPVTVATENEKYSQLIRMPHLYVLVAVLLLLWFFFCARIVRRFRKRRASRLQQERMLSIFRYLQPFEVDDIDVQACRAGGFNITYQNDLVNRPHKYVKPSLTSSCSFRRPSDGYNIAYNDNFNRPSLAQRPGLARYSDSVEDNYLYVSRRVSASSSLDGQYSNTELESSSNTELETNSNTELTFSKTELEAFDDEEDSDDDSQTRLSLSL